MNDLTGLLDTAGAELPAARAAIHAGDAEADRLARDFERLVVSASAASRTAIAKAAGLHADDVMAPAGKARLLRELPAALIQATDEQLLQAEIDLDVLEGRHLAAILHHDSAEDANLRAELANYIAGIEPGNGVVAMAQLAANPRYATFLAGPMGASIAARFKFDAAILRKTALEALAVDGTPDQVRRSEALAAIPAARRVIGLTRGGRDHAAQETQRPPAREPSQALI